MTNISIKIEPMAGSSITNIIFECITLSKRLGVNTHCELNGVQMFFTPDSTIEEKLVYFNQMIQQPPAQDFSVEPEEAKSEDQTNEQ